MLFAQEHLPLITAICNPGLRDRHWASLAEVVGFEIRRDEVTSLKRLLEYDIATHITKLVEISDSASREWSIEKALDKMMTDWKGLAFELGPWKETGGCLKRSVASALLTALGCKCAADCAAHSRPSKLHDARSAQVTASACCTAHRHT